MRFKKECLVLPLVTISRFLNCIYILSPKRLFLKAPSFIILYNNIKITFKFQKLVNDTFLCCNDLKKYLIFIKKSFLIKNFMLL